MKTIYTIGYEGVTVAALVQTLVNAGVRQLIDVRAVPLSRKPGFSKNKLAERLAQADIHYLGLKDLGTPAAGRDAARKGRISEMQAIFADHLATPRAVMAMNDAIKSAISIPSCLLCFEHEPGCCHRLIVAEEMAGQGGFSVEHLNPVIDTLL